MGKEDISCRLFRSFAKCWLALAQIQLLYCYSAYPCTLSSGINCDAGCAVTIKLKPQILNDEVKLAAQLGISAAVQGAPDRIKMTAVWMR